MSERSTMIAVLWRIRWSADGKYQTAHVAAPSLAAAARLAQDAVAKTLGDNPATWPNVSFEPDGDVLWEA